MKVTFRCGGLDSRAWGWGLLWIVATGGTVAWLLATAEGAYYIAAWVAIVSVAIMAFCLMSAPRRIIVDDGQMEIRCLVESTYVRLESIVDVEVVPEGGLRGKVPFGGVYGFWGYYGYYLDWRQWKIYRVYAARRRGCVVIHTSGKRFVVSCNAPELLQSLLMGNGTK